MSELSMQPGLNESIASSAGSHARTSVVPVAATEFTERGQVCFLNCCGSCRLCDPIGCALRTSLLCELAGLTSCWSLWLRQATPAGRWWWVLETLERRIDGIESGSWPTARAEDSEQTGAHHGTPDTLTSAARMFPTPNAMDGERGPELRGTKAARGAGGVNLREAAAWSTPNARDWKDSGPTQGNRKSPNLGTQAHLWQTPTSADGGSTSRGGDRKGELLLGGQAAQDSRSTNGNRRGSLSSRWVAQLMGFPSDWCDLPTEVLCALSATR